VIADLPYLAFFVLYYGHHANGMSDWIAHMAISAMIYGFVLRLMHELISGQNAVLVCVVLAVLFMWGRARDQRR